MKKKTINFFESVQVDEEIMKEKMNSFVTKLTKKVFNKDRKKIQAPEYVDLLLETYTKRELAVLHALLLDKEVKERNEDIYKKQPLSPDQKQIYG